VTQQPSNKDKPHVDANLPDQANGRCLENAESAKPSSDTTHAAPKGPIPVDTTVEPLPREIGGQVGPEPTRYGDWEKNGRCTDF